MAAGTIYKVVYIVPAAIKVLETFMIAAVAAFEFVMAINRYNNKKFLSHRKFLAMPGKAI